jgi:hypothetical protein
VSTHLDSSDTERALREALSARARQVHPSSRLDAILREASLPELGGNGRRGLAFVGVAAAAAVVAGAVWVSRPAPEGARTVPAGIGSATPAPSAPPPPAAAPAGAVAHYVVGTNAGPGSRSCMVRTFTAASWTTDTSPSEKVLATTRSLVAGSSLWDGVTVEDARVSSSTITLDLVGAGPDLDAEQARLALRTLAWTAQAVIGEGDVPVALRTAGGGGLFGHAVPATLTRAGTPAASLCDIWIDHPAPDLSLSPGSLVVQGQAVAFEANVQWELRRGTTVVREGFTTASVGGPARGTFRFDLGRLEAGAWVLRVFTTSAEDGATVVAERLTPFVVE